MLVHFRTPESNDKKNSPYKVALCRQFSTRRFQDAGVCCVVNWQQGSLYLSVQTTDPVYGESKHRIQQKKKAKKEICA
jgi:hypothetical protein